MINLLKRFISIITVCLIILSSLVVPAFAFDATDEAKSPLTPFFDYDYIEVTSFNYDDMRSHSYLFNLKEVFYNVPITRDNGQYYEITYVLNDVYGSSKDLNIVLTDISLIETMQYNNNPVWTYEFYIGVDNESIEYITLHGREGFYSERSYANIFSDSVYACDANKSPLDVYWTDYIDVTYSGSIYYPTYSYDDFGNVKGRQLNTYNVIPNIMQGDFEAVSITPYYDLNDINGLYPDTNTDPLVYFSDFTTTITFSEIIDEMDYLLFEIHYTSPNALNSAKQFYDKYFPAYEFVEGNVDFVGWLRSAVGGVFELRVAPNITLGAILSFFLGVSAFIAFLKFFAGG